MGLLLETIGKIVPVSEDWRRRASDYILTLTMPPWALGRLLDLAVDLAGMRETLHPEISRKRILLFAGDHGITEENVSPSPKEVTAQMIGNFVSGHAGINVLGGRNGAEISVIDMGVDADLSHYGDQILHRKIRYGTANFAKGPAMSYNEALASIEIGIRTALEFGDTTDVFGTGDMGIGNTSPSSAILSVFRHCSVAETVGMGAGLATERIAHKIAVIERGLALNQPDYNDPLDILSKVGGLEIGGIAGAILGAASLRKPVLVDGFISGAGALIASKLCPVCVDYMIFAHRSAEPGHVWMSELLQKEPLLDLGFRLGEGTGAAMAMPLLDAAAAVLKDMATFQSAAVTQSEVQI